MERKEKRDNRIDPAFDPLTSHDLSVSIQHLAINNTNGHIYNKWLHSSKIDLVPLCSGDIDPEKILQQYIIDSETKLKITSAWVKYMKDATKFLTCAVCGEFRSKKINNFTLAKRKHLHFYKPNKKYYVCKYYKLQDLLKTEQNTTRIRRYQHQLRLPNIVNMNGYDYH